MMHTNKITSSIFCCFIILYISSCTTLQVDRNIFSVATTRTDDLFIAPIIADLNIDQDKKTGTASGTASENLDIIKSAAIENILAKNNADILIAPNYLVVSDGRNVTVTASGYVARYINVSLTLAEGSYVESVELKESPTKEEKVLAEVSEKLEKKKEEVSKKMQQPEPVQKEETEKPAPVIVAEKKVEQTPKATKVIAEAQPQSTNEPKVIAVQPEVKIVPEVKQEAVKEVIEKTTPTEIPVEEVVAEDRQNKFQYVEDHFHPCH